jgi:outer membrane protein assembly factor BamB
MGSTPAHVQPKAAAGWLTLAGVLLVLAAALPGVARAAVPVVTPSPAYGPPGKAVKVSGSGFGARETVALAFDGTAIAKATTDLAGAFGATSFAIPRWAVPGTHTIAAVGSASGLSSEASFLVRTNWLQYGRDNQHTSYNPYEYVLTPGNVKSLTRKWTGQVELDPIFNQGMTAPPSVAGPYLYAVPATRALVVFDRYTGEPAWPAPEGFCGGGSAPAIAEGRVIWTYSQCSETSGGGAEMSDALDPAKPVPFLHGEDGNHGQPVVANGSVFFVAMGIHVYNHVPHLFADDISSGEMIWSKKMGSSPDLDVTVDNGIVFANRTDGLVAYNAATGAVRWTRLDLTLRGPIASGGVLYGATQQGLMALSEKTGATLWSKPSLGGVLAAAGGTLYVRGQGGLTAVRAVDGSVLWSNDAKVWRIAVANGVIYATADHTLSMYRASDGSLIASRTLRCCPYGTLTAPVVADGYVYVGIRTQVIAYGLP